MGHSSIEESVLLILLTRERLLAEEGYSVEVGNAVTVALTQPTDHDWGQIYLYIAGKI